MSSRAPSTRALIRLAPLDFIFNILVPLLMANTLALPNPWSVAIVGVGLTLARNVTWVLLLRAQLAPLDAWERAAARDRDEARLRQVLVSFEHTPRRFLLHYGAGWTLSITGSLLYAYLSNAGPLGVGPRFGIAAVLVTTTIVLGAGVFAYTTSGSVLRALALPALVEAQRRGLAPNLAGTALRQRIALLSIVIALTPLGWLGAIGLRSADVAAERQAEANARAEALAALDRVERGEPLESDAAQLLWLERAGGALGGAAGWAREHARADRKSVV